MHTTTNRAAVIRVSAPKCHATLFVLAILAVASSASATTIATWTFETSVPTTAGPFSPEVGAGSAIGSHASSATVYSSPSGNGSFHSFSSTNWGVGTVTILLANNQTGEKDVGQNLSDLFFTISTGQKSGTLSSSSGLERTVASNKSFTDGSTVAAGWVLSTSGASLHLDVLSGAGHAGPAHTILGPPTGNSYPNAVGSIAGNGPHNPFLAESATFVINVTGITAASTISAVTFSFGTTDGSDEINGIPVPEPTTIALVALGGLALLAVRWRLNR